MKLILRPRGSRWLVIFAAMICLGAVKPLAGSSQQDSSKAPPASQQSSPPHPASPPETYDPYHAAKSLEVGTFYMRRGDLDAAIDRFQDAIRLKYDYARPRLLLAEIYEKKHDYSDALRYYKEYLEVLPSAPDAKHVRGRIAKLEKRVGVAAGDS